ncbi:zeta toxin family protein [Plantibacter sp. RU18]|uniref:zeta toxin family protein n=1 Tax=Plantibacter sp. RU18 TaxID=3158143 RepID=UPI003D364BC7
MADQDLTEQHRRSVIALSKPGEALAAGAPHATVRNRAWFVQRGPDRFEPKNARAQLHDRLIAEQRDSASDVRNDRRAIVLAGPPGAGKSTVLADILGDSRNQYLVIDADEFKQSLLREAQRDGSYESMIKPPEIRAREVVGERFFPLELASLVHEESSILAGRLRTEAVSEGSNVVIDTVLSSSAAAQALGRQLDAAGYRIEVIDVEVPFEISAARITQRWQQSYEAALNGSDQLGGRWVPSEYAHDVYDGPGGMSRPEAAARELAADCPAVARYRVYRTIDEASATRRAPGSWEKDLVREQHGGPLRSTRASATTGSTNEASKQPAGNRSTPMDPELVELQRLRAAANGAAAGVNKNKPAPTTKPPTATGSRAPEEKNGRQR